MCGRLVNLDTVARVLAEYYHLKTDTQLAALDEALSRVPAETVGKELFGNSEQLENEKDHVADPRNMVGALISRQAAIDALWKALYEYEDETEKKFQESEDLDIQDWIQHRIFVQNMSDIDRQTILNLPSAQPEIIRCKDCKHWTNNIGDSKLRDNYCNDEAHGFYYQCSEDDYCSFAERRTDE